jgi:hypothetical protein
MKLLVGLLGTVSFFAVTSSAFGDAACQKCTHDMQVQYRACMKSGKDQAVCGKEQLTAAQACIAICNKQATPP